MKVLKINKRSSSKRKLMDFREWQKIQKKLLEKYGDLNQFDTNPESHMKMIERTLCTQTLASQEFLHDFEPTFQERKFFIEMAEQAIHRLLEFIDFRSQLQITSKPLKERIGDIGNSATHRKEVLQSSITHK